MIHRNVFRNREDFPSGFALIEVLVSLAVLAIGLVAVLTATLSALHLQKDASQRFRAGLILQEKLAEVGQLPYNGRAIRGVSADSVFSWSVDGTRWASHAELIPDAEGEAEPDSAGVSLYQVAVDVRWHTHRGERNIGATRLVRLAAAAPESP